MKPQSHLWLEPQRTCNGRVIAESVIEFPGIDAKRLWFSLPEEHAAAMSQSCDPFVLGTLFLAMRSGHPLLVHGEVSPSLLRNLREFQMAWRTWFPHRYWKVDIAADIEREYPKADRQLNLAAFSGGLDSCFTVWRHSRPSPDRFFRQIQAAIMVHGFDVPLAETHQFELAVENSKKILRNSQVELISVATNFKEINRYWGDAHGAGLAFCLMMLQGKYSSGLIASSVTYDELHIPWGSNPITDVLMSSESFTIVHDGSGFSRNEKALVVSTWPEAIQNLRVCWEGEQRDQNCGVCPKCIRTILNFRVMGAGLPASFKQDVSNRQISRMKGLDADEIYDLRKIFLQGRETSPTETWVKALQRAIWRNRLINKRNQLWQRIRGGVIRRCRLVQSWFCVRPQKENRETGKT